jgi:hypothetical protein
VPRLVEWAVGALLLVAGCGYHAVHGGQAGADRLHVRLVSARVADPTTADELLSGVREGLAREGLLAPGDGYPRVEVEVLRLDETSDGIADVAGAPRARGTRVGVAARAWIVAAEGAPQERDTGDLRAFDLVTVSGGAPLDTFRHADATRAVARRLGGALVQKLLGFGAVTDESLGYGTAVPTR